MNYISLRGVIRGNAVELDRDAGLADGETVEVIVRPVGAATSQSDEGLLRTERRWPTTPSGMRSWRKSNEIESKSGDRGVKGHEVFARHQLSARHTCGVPGVLHIDSSNCGTIWKSSWAKSSARNFICLG